MRIVCAAVVLAACGPTDRDNPAADAASQGDAPDAPIVDTSRVYAHSGKTDERPSILYLMNSVTLATTEVGELNGLGNSSLTDLALDSSDRMLGISFDKLWEIDPRDATLTFIADLTGTSFATSLSFVPSDLDDPTSPEILVTVDSAGVVFEIDPETGQTTQIGDYGTLPGGKVRSSGDLFAVRGLGVYATVDIGEDDNEDFLAKIDPAKNWEATPIGSGTGFDKIFGVGFWGGKIYGFVDDGPGAGRMIQIDINTGAAVELAQSGIQWFGAGVATDAPLL